VGKGITISLFSAFMAAGLPGLAYGTSCDAGTVADLKECVATLSNHESIRLTSDVVCSGSDCCNLGQPLVRIASQANKVLEGQGHTIRRTSNQRFCPVIEIANSDRITVRNLVVDEGHGPPCEVADNCTSSVSVRYSRDVSFNNVEVLNGKGYVVHLWGVDGFDMFQSGIFNAGIIGFYVGHEDFAPSYRIRLRDSYFVGARANGIAIEGARGMQVGDNLISGNVIQGNHWHGLWTASPGVIHPGGQLLIAMGGQMAIRENVIADGFCENCARHAVGGIELGTSSHPTGVRVLEISNNAIYNNHESPMYLNEGASLDGSVRVLANRLTNNGSRHSVPGAMMSGNTERLTRHFEGWESLGSWPASWSIWKHCSADAQAVRWCPGTGGVMDGQCALRMITAQQSCKDGWQGIWAQGLYQSVLPGANVQLSTWTRNGGYEGRACIVFHSDTFVELAKECRDISADSIWRFVAAPMVEAVAPPGTATVSVRLGVTSQSSVVDFENIRLTW
jgi:hypothetical protein